MHGKGMPIATSCWAQTPPRMCSRTSGSGHFWARPPWSSSHLPRMRSRTSISGHFWAQATFGLRPVASDAQQNFGLRPLASNSRQNFRLTKVFDNKVFDSKFRLHEGLRQQVPPGLRPFTSVSQQNSYSHGSSPRLGSPRMRSRTSGSTTFGSGHLGLNHSPRIRSGISPFGAQASHLECLRKFTFGAQANHLGRAAGVHLRGSGQSPRMRSGSSPSRLRPITSSRSTTSRCPAALSSALMWPTARSTARRSPAARSTTPFARPLRWALHEATPAASPRRLPTPHSSAQKSPTTFIYKKVVADIAPPRGACNTFRLHENRRQHVRPHQGLRQHFCPR